MTTTMAAFFAVLVLVALVLAWVAQNVTGLGALNLSLIGALFAGEAWTLWTAFAVSILVTFDSALRLYLRRVSWTP